MLRSTLVVHWSKGRWRKCGAFAPVLSILARKNSLKALASKYFIKL